MNFLKAQWKNLRDNLKRCMVKRAALTKSGAAAHLLPKCKFFNQLQFVQEKITNKETVSNFNIAESVVPSPASVSVSSEASDPPENNSFSLNSPEPPTKKRNTNKRFNNGSADTELLGVIKDMNTATKSLISSAVPENKIEEKDNENALYCKSVAKVLDRFSTRNAAMGRMKIQNILFELEFNEQ